MTEVALGGLPHPKYKYGADRPEMSGLTVTLLPTVAVSSLVDAAHPAVMKATANVAAVKMDRVSNMGVSSLIDW